MYSRPMTAAPEPRVRLAQYIEHRITALTLEYAEVCRRAEISDETLGKIRKARKMASAVSHGTSSASTAAPPTAPGASPGAASTSSVSASCFRREGLVSACIFYLFTLFAAQRRSHQFCRS